MPISTTEELLAQYASDHPTHDWALQRLLNLTDFGDISIGVQISVILGGKIVRGQLLSPRRFGARLDSALREGIDESLQNLPGDSVQARTGTQWRDAIEGSFEAASRQRDETEEEDQKRLEDLAKEKGIDWRDLELEDLPKDLAFSDAVQKPYRSAFAIENAVMLAPPMNREDSLGTIRVQVAQIEAWWLNGIADSDPPRPDTSDPAE